jgi:superfamily II DNA or RNA helicase
MQLNTKLTKLTQDKLATRLQNMFDYESDNYLVNINLKQEISQLLFSYQLLHIFNLITAFRTNSILLDGSDTGTGKTYTAIALCAQLGLRPFIICPKTVMNKWLNVCNIFNVDYLNIINYEAINKTILDINDNVLLEVEEKVEKVEKEKKDKKENLTYNWKLPKRSIIIFDEAHKCKNPKTNNGRLLMSVLEIEKNIEKNKENFNKFKKFKKFNKDKEEKYKEEKTKVLLVSATISDSPANFSIFGYLLGFYSSLKKSRKWILSMLREDKLNLSMNLNINKLSNINKKIYPYLGSRVKIEELGDAFPQNQICADCYTLEDKTQEEIINKNFKLVKNLLTSNSGKDTLKDLNDAKYKLEQAKLNIFENLIQEYIDNGYSVVVFVNFVNSVNKLVSMFKDREDIALTSMTGFTSLEERNININLFQENKSNLIISTIRVGGLGIDLHDLNGKKRVSLISPTYSSVDLIQALGRIARAGSKSPALQRIIYTSNTVEEAICLRVTEKIKFLNDLNNNDLLNL